MPNTETLFPGFREHRDGTDLRPCGRIGASAAAAARLSPDRGDVAQDCARSGRGAYGRGRPTCSAMARAILRLATGAVRRTPSGRWRCTWSYLMADLGFDTFSLAGHDRGGRVSYRLALGPSGAG